MKRYLLFVIAFVCVSIGMRAQGYSYQPDGTLGTEKVKVISIDNAGVLSAALAGFDQSQYDYIRIIGPSQSLTLTDDDIAALGNVTTATLDLQMLNASAFTFSNSNVKNVILPDGWTKEEVKAVGQLLTSSNAVISFGTYGTGGKLTAYVNTAGTLRTTLQHSGYDQSVNTKLASGNGGTGHCGNLKALVAMGNICAKDISRAGNYDANGHYVINGIADENADPANSYNKNTAGGNLYTAAENPGALDGCYPIEVIDLNDAFVDEAYATDVVVGYNGMTSTNLKEVWMPNNPGFKTIPADYLNVASNYLHQIFIPSYIETIKTRAFAGTRINYIWTAGDNGNTVYDNGAYFVSGTGEVTHKYKDNPDPTDPENVDWAAGDDNNFNYGTITLPASLKLIERHAFYSCNQVRDLYVLAAEAPECHLDAFSSVMYHANNTLNASSIKEEDGVKIITRDAYTMSNYEMMTMLHYPRTSGTPQSQRYTDPSREYSIATGERDGNGNMLYFPTQTEFETAHDQGTFGYLWNGWKIERTWYNNEVTLGTGGGYYGSLTEKRGEYGETGAQERANAFYEMNDLTDVDKTTCSFYDVTIGKNNQPGLVNKPVGLKDYWTNYRNGNQLYPQMEATVTQEVIGYRQEEDAEGHLQFVPGDCDWVQDYSYVQDNEGLLYWDRVVTENNNGNYVKDYECVEATDGGFYHPFVKETQKDQNKCNAGVYWYFKTDGTYNPNPNGNYVDVNEFDENQPAYYATIDQAKQWGKTDEQLASYTHYSAGGSWIHLTSVSQDNYAIWNNDVYYVGEGYAPYDASGVVAGVNETRYRKVYSEEYRLYNASTDEGEQRYDVTDNGLRDYNSATDTDNSKRYTKQYKDFTYRKFDPSKDAANEPRWCEKMVPVYGVEKGKQNDYRGWHQFVLVGVSHNSKIPFEPLRSFITDNDWWTICEPYDLRYSDLKKFFGTDRQGLGQNIPYLSKLMYVIRDVEHQTITLMFSKNLMEYKEQFRDEDGTAEGRVHGYIDDETKWPATDDQGRAIGTEGYDPIILHAGVPYMIRPNLTVDATTGKIDGLRKFDIYKNDLGDLYDRLHESLTLSAGKQFDLVYNGEYTVPAYVVGESSTVTEGTTNTKQITMKDGTTFNYSSVGKTIKYHGKDVPYSISTDFTYTFVGTFYKSAMPQYCYFLGWDSEKNRAAFWYSRTLDKSGWNWNNETGIICPNFNTNLTIHQATSFNDPARWQFNPQNKEDKVEDFVMCDDFKTTQASAPKQYTMDYGATMNLVPVDEDPLAEDFGDQNVLSIDEIQSLDVKGEWYNVNGQKLNGRPTQSGVYIMGHKKYVVK